LDRDAFVKPLIVPPGRRILLARDYDPNYRHAFASKEEADELLRQGIQRLAEYQDMLYAQDTYALLIIFQALDAAGKDGAIKHVMSGINPQGCQVYSFKVPSAEEMDHDFMWRNFKALPERGRIGIFNRSYYEEVLVVRVHPEILERQQIPPALKGPDIWQRRFEAIRSRGGASSTASTSPRRTGSSRRPTCKSGCIGTPTWRPTRTCSTTPAPPGRPGTSSPPIPSGSPAWRSPA